MKTVVSLTLGILASATLAYLIASNRATSRHQLALQQKDEAFRNERQRFNAALDKARQKSPLIEKVVKPVAVPVPTETDPQQHIDNLIALAGQGGDRNTRHRRIVHQFEALVDAGQRSLPVIQTFLGRNEDLEFERSAQAESVSAKQATTKKKNWLLERSRSLKLALPSGSFNLPPTLRLGLLEVVFRVGGPDAESLLAGSLPTASDSREIAWLTAWLENLAPGVHRAAALNVAGERLANLTPDSEANQTSRRYLYSVLAHFGDNSFHGSREIVTAEGRIDLAAAGYLRTTLKENVMPLIATAYTNPAVQAPQDRRRLIGMSQEFFGSHPQANEMFQALMESDLRSDSYDRYFAIESLDGGGLPEYGKQPPPSDPSVIQNRINLIEQFVATGRELDPKTAGLMEHTYNSLQRLANGEPPLAPYRPGPK